MNARRFVDEARSTLTNFSAPVRSLMDIDFYKFLMGQFIWQNYPDVEVVFKLIIRDKFVRIADVVSEAELRKYLDYAMTLQFTKTDIYYLRGMDLYGSYMFKEGYLDFLKTFKLPPYELQKVNGDYELTFWSTWPKVTMWENIALATISELYYRALKKKMTAPELELMYAHAMVRVSDKLSELAKHPRIRFADFGQRRRHSFLWQEWVVGLAKSTMGDQFVGTSNTWMAFHHDLSPIGTNAHELPMVLVALAKDEDKIDAQYEVLRAWEKMYGQGLRIFLPDTYGTKQFLDNAPEFVSDWKGFRQDSSDPITRARMYMDWLRKRGIDPHSKLMIPSDGLDVGAMEDIDRQLSDEINLSYGWGTYLTNDFRGCHPNPLLKPFSLICKPVEANSIPCVKLSDNPEKATGPISEIKKYQKIFSSAGRSRQHVYV